MDYDSDLSMGQKNTGPFFLFAQGSHGQPARRLLRPVKTLVACLAVCLIFSCSSTRLTYTYLDWIIDWYLDGYLSLNRQQDALYKHRLAALLRWHRTDQLVRYSAYIARLQQDLNGPLTALVLQERYADIKQFWRAIMERAAPDCAELLLLLDQDQRRTFYAAAAKKQQELEGKYGDEAAAQRNQRQREQAAKAIERFTGVLTEPQNVLLARWSEALMPVQPLWLENRRDWQRSLRAVLEETDPDAEKRGKLCRLFVEPEYLWTPAYRLAVQRNEAATVAMLADLQATLTEKQRQHLNAALEKLQTDFISLSRQ